LYVRVAYVNSASIVIIAILGGGNTLTVSRVARGDIALISASEGIGGEDASGTIVASISCAGIVIIANGGGHSTSSCGVATSYETLVGGAVSTDINVLATSLRGNQHGTQVLSASIVVVTQRSIRCRAATLSITLTNITPIVVSASNLNRGSELKIGSGSVSFAVEEIESVVGTDGQSHIIDGNGTTEGSVNTSQINHQFGIEVYPQVIISSEREDLSTLVREMSVNLKTEGEVVVLALGFTLVVIFPTLVINGEELSVVSIKSTTERRKSKIVEYTHGSGTIVEPSVVRSRTLDGIERAVTGVLIYGSLVIPQCTTVLEIVGFVTTSTNQARFTIV
jgi:hypothetical protein